MLRPAFAALIVGCVAVGAWVHPTRRLATGPCHQGYAKASRRVSLWAEEEDGVDWDAIYKERIQDADVRFLAFGEEMEEGLDWVKMQVLGKEAVGVAVAAIVGALALLSSGIFFAGSKSPLREEPVVIASEQEVVCITGNCKQGTKVEALQFSSENNAADRLDALSASPRPFSE